MIMNFLLSLLITLKWMLPTIQHHCTSELCFIDPNDAYIIQNGIQKWIIKHGYDKLFPPFNAEKLY